MNNCINNNCINCNILNKIINNLKNDINELKYYINNIIYESENNKKLREKEKKKEISILDYIKYIHLKELFTDEEFEIIKYNINKKNRLKENLDEIKNLECHVYIEKLDLDNMV